MPGMGRFRRQTASKLLHDGHPLRVQLFEAGVVSRRRRMGTLRVVDLPHRPSDFIEGIEPRVAGFALHLLFLFGLPA